MKLGIRRRIDEAIIETLRNVEPTVYRPKKPEKSKLKTYTKDEQRNNSNNHRVSGKKFAGLSSLEQALVHDSAVSSNPSELLNFSGRVEKTMCSGFQVSPGSISGNISVVALLETTPGTPAPTNIIARNEAWRISASLKNVHGPGVGLLSNNVWHARAFLESIGPGFEAPIGPTVLFTMPSFVPQNFSHTFDINVPPATTIPGLNEGEYILSVLLTLHDAANNPLPISAFADGTISLYNAV